MKLIRYEYPQTTKAHSLDHLFDCGMPTVKRFGELFDDFWNFEKDANQLAANLYEDENSYFAQMELPGESKESINLELENSVLTCSGNHSEKTKGEESSYSFSRSISVPDGVALNEISASYENGILTVKMPKSSQAKPQQIKVK